jgi:hypothetical protein
MEGMSKALPAVYFVLTFIAGAVVGSWMLWIYLMGAPQEVVQTPAPVVSPVAPPTAPIEPRALERDSEADDSSPLADDEAQLPPTPTPKGHWNTVDVPGKSHEECLAITKELNDAYKDCRFGVHKQVWVPEDQPEEPR